MSNETHDSNRDPITGTPGSHPVGTGVGAAGGATAGAVAGTAVAGPAGGLVGGALGALLGGAIGKSAAESIDPTVEETFWRDHYQTRPYYRDAYTWDDYQPAYRYGWESRVRYHDDPFDRVENKLEAEWEEFKGDSKLRWEQAKQATRDAWDRLTSWFDDDEEEEYWRNNFSTRPYARGESFETYLPAYRYGWEQKRRYPRSAFERMENELEQEWNELKYDTRLGWEKAKQATRDAWHRVERALPGDFDNDGR